MPNNFCKPLSADSIVLFKSSDVCSSCGMPLYFTYTNYLNNGDYLYFKECFNPHCGLGYRIDISEIKI